jgi:hypothetical protein
MGASPVVKFEANEQVEVALRFPEGKIVSGRWGDQVMYSLAEPAGHVMFLGLDVAQKVHMLEPAPEERFVICKRNPKVWDMWLSPDTEKARAAREAGIPMKDGRPAWGGNAPAAPDVQARATVHRVLGGLAAGPEPRKSDQWEPKPADDQLERQLRASLAEVERKKAESTQRRRDAEKELESSLSASASLRQNAPAPREAWTEMLLAQTNALCDVFRAACEHAPGVDPESVRTLMVTAFINLAKRGQ